MSDIVAAASHSASAGVAEWLRRWWRWLQHQFVRPLPVIGLAVVAGAVAATAAFPNLLQLHRVVLWSVVLLVSFAGWGNLIGRLAFPDDAADLGLRLAWGMAALVVLGGIGCWAGVANRWMLLALVFGGLVLASGWGRGALGRRHPAAGAVRGPPPDTAAALGIIALLAVAQLYGGAAATRLQSDDYQSYLVFPQKILTTGTLLDVFSTRRLAAYGGQSLLHALVLAGTGTPLQVPVLDTGIALVVVIALLVGDRFRKPLGLWVLPVALVVAMPNVRANSTSMMTGVAIFLALYRTASSAACAAQPRRCAALLGMLAGVAASLRQPYIVPATVFMVLLYLPNLGRAALQRGAERWRRLAEVGIAAAAMLAVVAPWALLSYRSSGTLLFPLFDGNYHPEYGRLTGTNPDIERLDFLWINVRHCYPIRTLPLFLIAALWVPWRRTRGALPALTLASVLGFAAIVWAFPLSDEWSVARYYSGFVVAAVLAVAMFVCAVPWTDWRGDPIRTHIPALLTVVAILLQLATVGADAARDYVEFAARVGLVASRATSPLEPDPAYTVLQARVPEAAAIAVMADRPFWFDFGRNRIDVLDLPGNVSPPPGLPLDSEEALVKYLTRNGYYYLAFIRSTQSEGVYLRKGWVQMLGPPPSPLWGNAAPRYLKTFDHFENLMKSRIRLYDDGKMVLLDLTRLIGRPDRPAAPSG
jgi:hypothetical protein